MSDTNPAQVRAISALREATDAVEGLLRQTLPSGANDSGEAFTEGDRDTLAGLLATLHRLGY